jgi:hypothetical protein
VCNSKGNPSLPLCSDKQWILTIGQDILQKRYLFLRFLLKGKSLEWHASVSRSSKERWFKLKQIRSVWTSLQVLSYCKRKSSLKLICNECLSLQNKALSLICISLICSFQARTCHLDFMVWWFLSFWFFSSSVIYQPTVATAVAVTTTITITLRPCCLMNQRSRSLFSIGLIKTN